MGMLVVTRRLNEVIVVPDANIRIVMCGVKGYDARIGVDAPKDYAIHREEVWKKLIAAKVCTHCRKGELVPITATDRRGRPLQQCKTCGGTELLEPLPDMATG